jgi:type I restriction enzyme S subunit
LPVPSISRQKEYLNFVAQVDKSRFVAQQQIEKLQMLYDSLAQEYFGD